MQDAGRSGDMCARATTVLLVVAFFLMPLLSFDFGVTWDEPIRAAHGDMIVDYYTSGFDDTRALDPENEVLKYYGALFDSFTSYLHELTQFDLYPLRHVVNSLLGWLILLYVVRLAVLLYGRHAGLVALFLMLISPRFIGHSMNNPKDIPFAAFFLAATYYLLQFTHTRSIYSKKHIGLFILFASLCLLVRPGALLLLFYLVCILGCVVLSDFFQERTLVREKTLSAALWGMVTLILIFPLGTLFWPWAQLNPYWRPIEALQVVSQFPWESMVLYQGEGILATNLPWHYIPTWIGITSPLVVLLFFFLGLGRMLYKREEKSIFLVFFMLFPPVYVMIKGSVVYDGYRHLLFIYPMMVVLAAGALVWAKDLAAKRTIYTAALTMMVVAGSYHSIYYMVRNHPNEVVYFNQIVGGVKGALYQYELDYWGNCLKQSAQWLHEKALEEGRQLLVAPGPPEHLGLHYLQTYDSLVQADMNAEYIFFYLRDNPEYLRKLVSSFRVVHQVTAGGAPICLVWKMPSAR